MTNAVSILIFGVMIGMSKTRPFLPQVICSTNKNALDKISFLCYIYSIKTKGGFQMITFYMVYLGGQYIEREIEAPTKEEAYAELTDEERENYYLLSEAEYDAAFGCDDDDGYDECGFNPFLGCYDWDE